MSPVMWTGVALQTIALGLVLRRLGRRFVSHLGALFLVAAFAFHGLTEILQVFTGPQDARRFADQRYYDAWVFIVGAGMLGYALVYVLFVRPADPPKVPEVPAWRPFIYVVAVPYLMTISGLTGYWIRGLTQSFFVITSVIVAYVVVQRWRAPWLAVAVCQATALALLGSRSQLLAGAVLFLVLMTRYGIRSDTHLAPAAIQKRRRRRTAAALFFALTAFVFATAARSVSGRQAFREGGVAERVNALTLRGGEEAGNRRSDVTFAHSVAHRLDGNFFPGLIRSRERYVTNHLGTTTLQNNLAVTVPSFIYKGKLASLSTEQRSEEYGIYKFYGLPEGIDYLPTQLGTIYSYYGQGFLLVAMLFIAAGFAILDNWLHRTASPAALLVTVALGLSIFFYEKPVLTYFLQIRAAAALGLIWLGIAFVQSVASRRGSPHQPAEQPRPLASRRSAGLSADDPMVEYFSRGLREALGRGPR